MLHPTVPRIMNALINAENRILGKIEDHATVKKTWHSLAVEHLLSNTRASHSRFIQRPGFRSRYTVCTISVDNPKLRKSEHKQNELINASKSTHIEISSSTDMDYDVTKISPLQLDKRGQIVSPSPSSPPTRTSKSTIDHPSSPSDNSNQVQNDNHLHFEFGLPVQEVLRHLIPGIPGIITKEDNERQIWFSGILDKSTCQVISATVGRITLS